MSDWKMILADHILARGKNNCNEGEFQKLRKTEYGYHAIVEGSEEYNTQSYL